jgi:hypothetical protein
MAASDLPTFEGTWIFNDATLPNGEFAYTGTLAIQRIAASFALDWDISAGRYVGVGLALDDHLFVSCGEQHAGLGLALYHLQADAKVRIEWCTAEMHGAIGNGAFTTAWRGSFEGDHRIVQSLPDGRLYGEWDLAIQRVDQIYELTWRKGEAIHFKGLGLDTPHGLAAGWYPDPKQLAFLDYTTDAHDAQRLTAVWALGGYTTLGTETLLRR